MGLFRNLLHLTSSGKQDYYYNFSVGDYVPIGSTRLEYLQSSGTQYVDTDIVPGDDNVKVEIKYQYLENKSTGYDSVMGSHEISGGTTRFMYLVFQAPQPIEWLWVMVSLIFHTIIMYIL